MKLLPLLDRLRMAVYTKVGLKTLGAMTLLVDDEGKILLIRQTYGVGKWTLPGGGVKRHESFREAALRESCEEAGIRLRDNATVDLLGLYIKRIGRWVDHIAVFVVTGWDRTEVDSREIAATGLFSPSDLPDNIAPSVANRIAEWRNARAVSEHW